MLFWYKYCFFLVPILLFCANMYCFFWCIFNFSSQKYTILMLNKPLSCLNAFFGTNIVFYAKIARLFWNNKIILLYHLKVGEKEIIPLDLSHKQKLVLNFQATREVDCTHHCFALVLYGWYALLVIRAFNFTCGLKIQHLFLFMGRVQWNNFYLPSFLMV